LRRNKSDTADVRLIADFLQSEHSKLRPWAKPSADTLQVRELSRYAESITQDNSSLKTRYEMTTNKPILRSLRRRIKVQEKEIADIRQRINKIVEGNEALHRQRELLARVPGIGDITCQILLA
jgi:transposase|tara:strand:+ start:412 stop:780 length:369 start_codon:yes stop_codon:yes gene_type:complete